MWLLLKQICYVFFSCVFWLDGYIFCCFVFTLASGLLKNPAVCPKQINKQRIPEILLYLPPRDFVVPAACVWGRKTCSSFVNSTLIYTAVAGHGSRTLMVCNSDGTNAHRFFGNSLSPGLPRSRLSKRSGHQSCSCDPHASVGSAVTLDRSQRSAPRLLWVDESHGNIWSADLQGCNCTLVVNATEMQNAGEDQLRFVE